MAGFTSAYFTGSLWLVGSKPIARVALSA